MLTIATCFLLCGLLNYSVSFPKGPEFAGGIKPKQNIQQLQIAVVLPPGVQPSQSSHPPGPAAPGYVWVQVPITPTGQQVQQPTAQEVAPAVSTTTNKPIYVPSLSTTSQPVSATSQPDHSDVLLQRCLSPRGQFPSTSCNKYVNCWDGAVVEQYCPDALLFNTRGYCDYPANVNCGQRPVIANPALTTTTAPSFPAFGPSSAPTESPPTIIVTVPSIDSAVRRQCLTPRGQYRSTVCNKYVNCWDDAVFEQECPEGLLFSSKGYCDYPANVDCQDSIVPPRSAGAENAITAPECLEDTGTFRDKSDCSKYFTCIGGKVVANNTCLDGFKFNANIGVCDWEYRVDCTDQPFAFNPKVNFLSRISQEIFQKINDCTPGTAFALDDQCSSACLCRDGISEIIQCPTGLAYNIESDKCLLPHVAQC